MHSRKNLMNKKRCSETVNQIRINVGRISEATAQFSAF